MKHPVTWAAIGAAFSMVAATEAASARGIGGNNDGDGYLRQEMQNPSFIEPSPYAYSNGYRRNDPGAEYEAYRRGYPLDGPWGSRARY